METWSSLYLGSRGGSPVVPYSPEMSYLLYAVNTDTSLGPSLRPTMPIGGAHLTAAEYHMLEQWIADGARNVVGELRFPDIATRRKWYVTNQGCDLVAVLDAESRQIMRYVSVGQSAAPEQPHNVKVSKDGNFWYAVFLSNNPYLEQYSTLTDQKVAQIRIGNGNWNTFTISEDGKFGVAVSFLSSPGASDKTVVIVDLVNGIVSESLHFDDPVHGSCAHPTLSRYYITKQSGNELITIDYDSQGHVVNDDVIDLLQGHPAHAGDGTLRPHEVIFAPDGSKYFVTCQSANEVRVYESTNNTLLQVINVGDEPVEMAMSPTTGQLFVTCMEDITSFPNAPQQHGSVAVIDVTSNALVKSIYTGYQPHGVVIDAASGYAIVANRNVNPNGPAPHHTTSCGGRNGYLTAIDLSTLELIPNFKCEMSSDPYSVAVKR
jgi:DNA-binding beta-propeller fold protein YncE